MDAEPVSEGKAEHTDTLNAEQPGSSRAAEAPTTLLEELLGLPAPEYASLAAAPAQGAHPLHVARAQSLLLVETRIYLDFLLLSTIWNFLGVDVGYCTGEILILYMQLSGAH